jgi:TetR/AcrR family transcriptional repressor of nem operon
MLRHGYAASGVREIVAEAGAPQGSFTNHFRSKEGFAGDVLDLYFEHTRGLVGEALSDSSLSPAARIRRYLDIVTARLADDGFARGCLIGDLSLEAAPVSEVLRDRLSQIFVEWRRPFAACVTEAHALGQVRADLDPDELADFLLASWEGAILRMKVERSAAPLERFKAVIFRTIFKESSDA